MLCYIIIRKITYLLHFKILCNMLCFGILNYVDTLCRNGNKRFCARSACRNATFERTNWSISKPIVFLKKDNLCFFKKILSVILSDRFRDIRKLLRYLVFLKSLKKMARETIKQIFSILLKNFVAF